LNTDEHLNQQLSTASGTPGIFVSFSSGTSFYYNIQLSQSTNMTNF